MFTIIDSAEEYASLMKKFGDAWRFRTIQSDDGAELDCGFADGTHFVTKKNAEKLLGQVIATPQS